MENGDSIKNYRLLSQYVYEEVKNRIIHDELKPNQKVTIVMLSEMLQVSRTPVREALAKLNGEGYITLKPNIGFVINGFSVRDAVDILEVRGALEGLAARRAARVLNDEGREVLRKFRESLDAIMDFEAVQRANELMVIDTNLHAAIMRISGNKRLCNLTDEFKDKLYRTRIAMETGPAQLRMCSEQHKQIIDAIISGNENEAERLSDEHIKYIMENMIPACGE